MTERNPFDHKPAGAGRESLRECGRLSCEEWEELLTEALDGLIPAEQRAPFDAHAAGCVVCGELLKQANEGREWLQFLESEPEVPSGMVERILGKTSGAAAGPLAAGGGPIPATPHVLGLPVRRVAWDTRMLMTVAMAFFSLALTLNLTLNLAGVRLTNLRLSDLTPASLETSLTRGFYGAKGSLVRYYDNLRLVYEVESKMRDLRRSEEMRQARPEQREVPQNPPGNGHKNGGKLEPSTKVPVGGPLWGRPEMAGMTVLEEKVQTSETEVVDVAVFLGRVRERGLA